MSVVCGGVAFHAAGAALPVPGEDGVGDLAAVDVERERGSLFVAHQWFGVHGGLVRS